MVRLSIACALLAVVHGATCLRADDLARIDVHAHFVPPFWREASIEHGHGQPDGMPSIPVSDDLMLY